MAQASVTTGWGQIKPRRELKLSSGNIVIVQELDLAAVMMTGVMDSIDIFTQEMSAKEKKAAKAKGLSEEQALTSNLVKDISKLDKVLKTVDSVVAQGLVEPKVHLLAEGETTEEDRVYAHLIPLEDRMEIFEAVIPNLEDMFPDSEGSGDDVEAVEAG